MLEPLGPIAVDFPEAVVRTAADGTAVLELPAGPQELTAEQAAAVLFTRTPNETEAVRLPAQQAVWKGIVDAAARVGLAGHRRRARRRGRVPGRHRRRSA